MSRPWLDNSLHADRVVNQCVGFPAGKYDDAVDACALIGLALENVHTARIPWVKKEEQLDSWARLFRDRRRPSQSWKTA